MLNINKKPSEAKVVVAMSGGVDSSTVAVMLHKAGYNVIGVTLQLYDYGMTVGKKGACCAGQDIHDARRVADSLGIPHYVLNYENRFRDAGFRAVPGAIVRNGAHVARNVVLMPSFVNIGAYVGEGTMVDTWATVGSCAQIGKNVHLSGGVGIGGVLEPLQANPTIIEDDCFIGARRSGRRRHRAPRRGARHGRLPRRLHQDRRPGHGRGHVRAGAGLFRGRAGDAAADAVPELVFLLRPDQPVDDQRLADDRGDAHAWVQRPGGILEDDLHLAAERLELLEQFLEMVVVDVDHPEIEDFIWWKKKEEEILTV